MRLKVRDEDTDLPLARVQATPDFLQVALVPCGTESRPGLYHLEISAAANAPRCVYRGLKLGELKLTFSHPRIPDLTLPVALAVMPRP